MKAGALRLSSARATWQAVCAAGRARRRAKIMAGSQSLGPMLNLRLVQPD